MTFLQSLLRVTTLLMLAAPATARLHEGRAGGLPEGVVASWQVGDARGLRLLSGADGVTAPAQRTGQKCVTTRGGANPASYLYFAVSAKPPPAGPLYVVAAYFDDLPSETLRLEYDTGSGDAVTGMYHAADAQLGGLRQGTHKWRDAVFVLSAPGFGKRENLHADFRLCGRGTLVRSVLLTRNRPAAFKPAKQQSTAAATVREAVSIQKDVHIGPGGQLIVRAWDPVRPEDAPKLVRAFEAAAPAMRAMGVTSREGSVRWNLVEPRQGHFDWSVYDGFVSVCKRYHIKWVPFLICGSPYSLPDWYYQKPGSQGYVCLEHHQESDVQSLWNPVLRGYVEQFIRAFCEHYRDSGVIEAILLGVSGNYGEALYPSTGLDWTAQVHGPYHTHPGIWAGDPYAVQDFRAFLVHRYGTLKGVQNAWGVATDLSTEELLPFTRAAAPSDRAWLDLCDWYTGSITEYSRFWLRTTRKYYPTGDLYLCMGGTGEVETGADLGEQCKLAAEFGAGARITTEGSDYLYNFSVTRWVASACRQYGGYCAFQTAGGLDPNGVTGRIYNATASGARGLHYYYDHVFNNTQAHTNLAQYAAQFKQRSPFVEIGVYYPETQIRLNGQTVLQRIRPLRERFDFEFESDGQIADGGLKRMKALVILDGSVAEAGTWRAIREWVRQGGLLLSWNGLGRIHSVEGDDGWNSALLSPAANLGQGRLLFYRGAEDAGFAEFLSKSLAVAPELSPLTRAMVSRSVAGSGQYVTACAPDVLLWLNTHEQSVVRDGVTVPGHGMSEARVRF